MVIFIWCIKKERPTNGYKRNHKRPNTDGIVKQKETQEHLRSCVLVLSEVLLFQIRYSFPHCLDLCRISGLVKVLLYPHLSGINYTIKSIEGKPGLENVSWIFPNTIFKLQHLEIIFNFVFEIFSKKYYSKIFLCCYEWNLPLRYEYINCLNYCTGNKEWVLWYL